MVTVNVPRVRGKMAEKGYNCTSISKELKISRNTLITYLNEPERMPYRIVAGLAELLCDDTAEAREIFFDENLRGT